MTLQVALIGTDGIVLAGDEKILNYDAYATTSLGPKILVDTAKSIAVSWADNYIAQTIASAIIKTPAALETCPELEQFVNDVYRKARRNWSSPSTSNPRGELLAMSQKNLKRVPYVEVGRGHCMVQPVRDKRFAGHIKNPGCYFVERYYKQGTLPVDKLVSLAAHAILAAGRFNPLGIEGLEIFTCTERGIECVTESQVDLLIQEEEQTDKQIRRLWYPHD